MLEIKRQVIKITGESGQGINSIGEIVAKALKDRSVVLIDSKGTTGLKIPVGFVRLAIDLAGDRVAG